jgi:glycosyltransferase involved in cell wall biosynthesis
MTDPHPNALATTARGRPVLSVLIPILHEDPRPLIERLDREIVARSLATRVEILVFDDGSDDPALAERIVSALSEASARARYQSTEESVGRAAARNRLAAAARGAWSVYLDADALPAGDDFLSRWLDIIAQSQPWIALGVAHCGPGGRASGAAPAERCGPHALEAALAPGEGAEGRMGAPACLLAHCDILAREPFDEALVGRGWEDVEWAMRASRRAPIQIAEIPLARTPPDDDAEELERCRSAAANFALLVRRHPELARSLSAFRAAQMFASTPALLHLRPLLAHAARRRGPLTPRGVRTLAAELWRASWYGEALR